MPQRARRTWAGACCGDLYQAAVCCFARTDAPWPTDNCPSSFASMHWPHRAPAPRPCSTARERFEEDR